MPAHAPFTQICQNTRPSLPGRVDMHCHSTASDGCHSPEQVVDLARRSGLAAIALTDHDTLAGYPAARAAARGVEVIPAVEISTSWENREVHLLGYFVNPDDRPLNAALDEMRTQRIGRYDAMVEKLRQLGVEAAKCHEPANGVAMGRRHLAKQLVENRAVDTIRDAFNRYLDDQKPAFVPKLLWPLPEAIRLVRQAGGLSSYAHPGNHLDLAMLVRLRELGLDAVEAEYPGFKAGRTAELRAWAEQLGMAVTGGSDSHGTDDARRNLGARSVSYPEFQDLRRRSVALWAGS